MSVYLFALKTKKRKEKRPVGERKKKVTEEPTADGLDTFEKKRFLYAARYRNAPEEGNTAADTPYTSFGH